MIVFIVSKHAKKELETLPREVQTRILDKLRILKEHPDIFSLLKPLKNIGGLTHRLRVGNYRLVLSHASSDSYEICFYVVGIGHRKDVYS